MFGFLASMLSSLQAAGSAMGSAVGSGAMKGAGALKDIGAGAMDGLKTEGMDLLKQQFPLSGDEGDQMGSRLLQGQWDRAKEGGYSSAEPQSPMRMLQLPSVRGSNGRQKLTARPAHMGGHNTMNYVRNPEMYSGRFHQPYGGM